MDGRKSDALHGYGDRETAKALDRMLGDMDAARPIDTSAFRSTILESISRLSEAARVLDRDHDFFGVYSALQDVRGAVHDLNNLSMKLTTYADTLGRQCKPPQTVESWRGSEPRIPPPTTAGTGEDATPRATDGPPSGLSLTVLDDLSRPHQDDAALGPDPFDGVLPADVQTDGACS